MARVRTQTQAQYLKKKRGIKRPPKGKALPHEWIINTAGYTYVGNTYPGTHTIDATNCASGSPPGWGEAYILFEAIGLDPAWGGTCPNPVLKFNLLDAAGNFIPSDEMITQAAQNVFGPTGVNLGNSRWVNTCTGCIFDKITGTTGATTYYYYETYQGPGVANIMQIWYPQLYPGDYTFTLEIGDCDGVSSNNVPLVYNFTINNTGAPCRYEPELTVCYTSDDPALLASPWLLSTPAPFLSYEDLFIYHYPVGSVYRPCQATQTEWTIDTNLLQPSDVGKSIDLFPNGPVFGAPNPTNIPYSGVFYAEITDTCADNNPVVLSTETHTSTICPSMPPACDTVAFNAIVPGYFPTWPHNPTLFYNPPVLLPGGGYSNGGTGIPTGSQMYSNHPFGPNIQNPNQFTICEWCEDWRSINSSVPGTFDHRVVSEWGWTISQAEAFCLCCDNQFYQNIPNLVYQAPPSATMDP